MRGRKLDGGSWLTRLELTRALVTNIVNDSVNGHLTIKV